MKTTKINEKNEVEQMLLKLPVPKQTFRKTKHGEAASYTPIPHSLMIQTTLDELKRRNLEVISKSFKIHKNGQGVIGTYGIKSSDSELGMMIAFRNSYDKSMSAGYVSGANVWICGNGVISGDVKVIRKHTGKADEDVLIKLVSCIDYMEDKFKSIIIDRDKLKSVQIDKKLMAELAGRLFIEQEIITSTQINIIKDEIAKPSFMYTKKGDTYWDFYNHVTLALKTTSPGYFAKKHIDTHNFIMQQI